ncbi:LOW QUALITY PROTEIN: olfactory receptor 6X1-like [Caretta caretta]|uniref:LOW QUALITY PROTEIN: olfactory receptor 6X1-like n=1 Tax=Caretta caretta TaxID=8467 RepID=UPI0020959059|nr:LOW QUALITY PROTEIN: olfactory receptor 6X1-like [Caretta caretta]
MCKKNTTTVNEFILGGFPVGHSFHIVFFSVILLMYILTIIGNGLIVMIVRTSHKLYTPMYFFLSNLSFLEIWYTTTVPKMLETFVEVETKICVYCCLVQAFFHFFMGSTEFFILAVMSFDRYLAICKLLLYATIMTTRVCLQLSIGAWFGGFMAILFQTILVFQLPTCDSNIINYFCCDIGLILKIACTDSCLIELLGFLAAITAILSSLMFTMVSYIYIISTIVRIPSATGCQKVFSTCASQLTVVSILYRAVMFMYLRPSVHSSLTLWKVVSVLNTVFTPLLNPFIYTIRNTKVKAASGMR